MARKMFHVEHLRLPTRELSRKTPLRLAARPAEKPPADPTSLCVHLMGGTAFLMRGGIGAGLGDFSLAKGVIVSLSC